MPTATPIPPTLPGLSIEILSPVEGSQVAKVVDVIGRYTAPSAHHGVVVRGMDGHYPILAAVGTDSRGQGIFVANNVPLVDGITSVVATVTMLDGHQAGAAVTVNASRYEPILVLTTKDREPYLPLAPASVTIRPRYWGNEPFVSVSIDYDGDGTNDQELGSLPEELTHTYTQPGLYHLTLTGRDVLDRETTARFAIQAVDTQELYHRLPEIWDLLRDRLRVGEVENALLCVQTTRRDDYRQIINRVAEEHPLSQIDEILTDIEPVDASWASVRFKGERLETDGQKLTYPAHFGLESDGVWRLSAF